MTHKMTNLERLRHSCAHVLATAILRLWPNAQLATGPPVRDGFYYDVELSHQITPEDFPTLEEEMRTVINMNQPFESQEISREEALQLGQIGRLAALGKRSVSSKFKIDILRNIPEGEAIILYKNGDFIDLCAGPHVSTTSELGAFKLTHLASVFYRGDERNAQLQRVYGTAFHTQEELNAHFSLLKETKRRDHRKLGKELSLFLLDEEVGPGLVLWPPAGAIIRQELQNFIGEELRLQKYQQVFTPHVARLSLFRTSGHFPYYAQSQFPPLIENETLFTLAKESCSCAELTNYFQENRVDGFLLKPMNCPMHMRIFASHPHSYRELPIRLAEFGTVYRWEQSGELSGMTRVRGFTQDDAHIFCTEEQIDAEIQSCLLLVHKVLKIFSMQNYRVRIGLRDPSTKYIGSSENWSRAEKACRDAAIRLGITYSEELGEAAFYGPKTDFVVRDVLNREWQLGTIQVDFNLPLRCGLSYIGCDGKPHTPVVIHRAPLGSLERFVGILIEHFAGNFPLWIAPEQVRVLPISDRFFAFAQSTAEVLLGSDIRASVDTSSERISAKIRLAQLEKVPYMLIVGGSEQASGEVSVRSRKRGREGTMSIGEFQQRIQFEVKSYSL
ncbi:threonine--tRNA ligase [Candidatus Xiphinematobacter sp. Idaho Grape]|uniref:threonine--tRNA ligase n=1 Tax=Candidatus Xiphinematobacter sp. Idaho Grape TaxID=1704307 RepID=UPI0007807602|nr:threonine--tRNA ligase [Candidatus Xiphinematobacter sp. Idaho Grape]